MNVSNRHVVRIGDPEYPSHMLLDQETPETLYCIGNVDLLVPGLAVIGSRKATPYGVSAARMFARFAAGRGVPVISGAARGCDQAAHRGALEVDGPTIAVMGCGADVVYPSDAGPLLSEIARTGLVVSQFDWGTRPTRWMFIKRNRLIAQLCRVLLVVEAAMPSGTFNTVNAAVDLSRDVYAVPGSIYAPECRGPNHLLVQGVGAIAEVSDLARVLDLTPELQQHSRRASSTLESNAMFAALRANPMRPDDAAYALGIDVVDAVAAIGELERAGHLTRYPGGRYGVVR